MKDANYYRKTALEALNGHWKSAVLSAFVIFLVMAVSVIPTIFANRYHTFEGLASIFQIVILLGVIFPLVYGFYAAFRKTRVGSEHYLFTNLLLSVKADYSRAVACFLWIMGYVVLIMIPIVIVAVIIVAVILNKMCPEDVAILDWLSAHKFLSMAVADLVLLPLSFPAVIYAYMVCLAPFIVCDNPQMPVLEALKESRLLMKGHKWQMFVLDLTFLGWALLAIVTLGLGILFVAPYQTMARTLFYEDVLAEKKDVQPE